MKSQPNDKVTALVGMLDHSRIDNKAMKLWEENPRLAFERLRDLVSESIQLSCLLYQDALEASPEESLKNLGSEVVEALHHAIYDAQEFWYDTPISRYLDRQNEPVLLSQLRSGKVTGSCFHDLALAVAVRVLQGIQGGESVGNFRSDLRFQTAAADGVALHLASLIPQVRCECQQAVSRWQAERQNGLMQNSEKTEMDSTLKDVVPGDKIGSANNALDRSGDSKRVPLSSRQYDILEALYQEEVFHDESRLTAKEIAKKAEGPVANAAYHKEPLANLRRRHLVDAKKGRDGGYWLTPAGRELIKAARNLK